MTAQISKTRRRVVGLVALLMFGEFVALLVVFHRASGLSAPDVGAAVWADDAPTLARIEGIVNAVFDKEALSAWLGQQPVSERSEFAGLDAADRWAALQSIADSLASSEARARLNSLWVRDLEPSATAIRTTVRQFHHAAPGSPERQRAIVELAARYRLGLGAVLSEWLTTELSAAELTSVVKASRAAGAALVAGLHEAVGRFLEHRAVDARIETALVRDLAHRSAPKGLLDAVQADFAGRRMWALVAAIFVLAATVAVVGGLPHIMALGAVWHRSLLVFYAAIVLGAVLVGLALPNLGPSLLVEPLEHFTEVYGLSLGRATNLLNASALAAIAALLVVAWSSFLIQTRDEAHLDLQLATLRWAFHTSSFVLVAGVVEMYMLFQWPSAFLNAAAAQLVLDGSRVSALSIGATFSTLLLLIYLPGASVLTDEARARQEADPAVKDRIEALLVRHGFNASPGQQALRFAKLFAPLLLAAPLAELIHLVE